MAAKKKTSTTPAGLQTLRIGGRVRCTDDGVEGQIVWANGVSVKIKWDDGEQVAWRRDSLAGRPIEILAGDEDQPAAPAAGESPVPEAQPAASEAIPEAPPAVIPTDEPGAAQAPPTAPESAQEPPAATTLADEPTAAQTPPAAPDAARAAGRASEAPAADGEPAPAAAKPKRQRKAPAEPKQKKLSAIDAAARVLAEADQPMTCQEMIGAMAARGYWTSPGGKTPAATLYSAVAREIQVRGEQARFRKADRGKFTLRDRA